MNLVKTLTMILEPCIRGHRATSCAHTDRILVEVRKPGRPLQSCGHKLDSCVCGRLTETFKIGDGELISKSQTRGPLSWGLSHPRFLEYTACPNLIPNYGCHHAGCNFLSKSDLKDTEATQIQSWQEFEDQNNNIITASQCYFRRISGCRGYAKSELSCSSNGRSTTWSCPRIWKYCTIGTTSKPPTHLLPSWGVPPNRRCVSHVSLSHVYTSSSPTNHDSPTDHSLVEQCRLAQLPKHKSHDRIKIGLASSYETTIYELLE